MKLTISLVQSSELVEKKYITRENKKIIKFVLLWKQILLKTAENYMSDFTSNLQ